MRDIKFRAYFDDNEKIDYIYFTLEDIKTGGDISPQHSEVKWLLKEAKAVEQFINKTDMNGKDIYNGDIARSGSYKFQIIWDEDRWTVVEKTIGVYHELPNTGCLEIVGNIHEGDKNE